jgi:signal transduction histidine kinase
MADVLTAEPRHVRSGQERAGAAAAKFEILVGVPVAVLLVAGVALHPKDLTWASLFFTLSIAATRLIPVPGDRYHEIPIVMPLMMGAAILFGPLTAGAIVWVGACDLREVQGGIGLRRAVWDRSRIALTIVVAAWVFQVLAGAADPWWRLLLATLAASVIAYVVETALRGLDVALESNTTIYDAIAWIHEPAPAEVTLTYVGLGLLGAVVSRFYLDMGAWSVIVFMAPLVFARQMLMQSRALSARMAGQNEIVAEQAGRIDELINERHRSRDQLDEVNRMKSDLVASVSHELRTPVTALVGYAKTLRKPEFADDAALRDEFLARMERQGSKLALLLDNLLTASQLEGEGYALNVGRVLFEDVVRKTLETLGSEAYRVQAYVPGDLPVMSTDRVLVGRVLSNLLDNALKYSPDDTPCELEAGSQGDAMYFRVTDHGIGIEPANLAQIFDRFYQVDSTVTRRFDGAGLGLSMVRDMLERLGGSVMVESTPGKGSRFTVTLPVSIPVQLTSRPRKKIRATTKSTRP